jgi:serine protease Do
MPRQMASPYGSSGSGWIWDDAGHIVTNAHVVEGAERLQVQLFDGELREAELVGLDLRTDIAVIKVSAGGLRPSLRGDSAKIEQGDLVYAFGSPFDFRFSMSSGIVSGLGRSAGLADIDYENFIQTDAAINPGNSGGPLTDIRGRVIGMNTAIATGRGNSVGQGQFAGIGLAIPMSMIESVVSQIIDSGEVRKGFLGVSVVSIDMARSLAARDSRFEAVAEGFRGEGAVVGDVTPDSPASEAGFREGDVIVTIDGQKVTSEGSVPAVVSSRRPGETVKFGVWRGDGEGGGKRIELSTKLAELDMSLRVGIDVPAIFERAGIAQFATATSERAAKLGVPYRRGILIEDLREGSELDEMLDEGSVITAVFDQQVSSVDEFYTRLARVFPTGMRVRRSEFPVTIAQPDGRIVQILLSVR